MTQPPPYSTRLEVLLQIVATMAFVTFLLILFDLLGVGQR